jgi:hypothetical protein
MLLLLYLIAYKVIDHIELLLYTIKLKQVTKK